MLQEYVQSVPDPPQFAGSRDTNQQRCAVSCDAGKETLEVLTDKKAAADQISVIRKACVWAERQQLHIIANILKTGRNNTLNTYVV